MNLVMLCIFWVMWCGVHSLLINSSVLGLVKKYASCLTRYYRLLYNGVSFVTLVPLIIVTGMAEGRVMVRWEGSSNYLRIVLLTAAFLLFTGGARQYDILYFLGLKQLQTGEEHLLLSDAEEFTESGVFGFIRHPWYVGSLLLLWSVLPRYPLPVFLAVCILSVYLVIGTMLEERKIIAQYGDSYRRYQQRVSMLFPWKWLMRLLK